MSVSQDASKVPAPQKNKSKKPQPSDEELALDGLMGEIEEDLRSEELAKLWKQYGNYVIAVIAAIILSVVGWQLWKQNIEKQRAAQMAEYESASKLVQEGKLDEAMTAYAAIAAENADGLAVLAQLQKAAIALEKGDKAGALAAYKALEDNTKADSLFRDFATLLHALHGIDSENPLQLESELKPLLNPSNAFYHSATELTALLAAKQGDPKRALSLAEALIADRTTPQGIRQRAEELAAMFRLAVPAADARPDTPKADAAPAPAKP
ncbi:MAG: tetratricopeptide repeat protein [Rhodospirillaceae bacterium]|nr:tetratricopeptide repeat protein [Rhodospirillaceae bacterium]